MADINLHFLDYSHAKVECDDDVYMMLRDHLSFFAEGYQFNPKFRYGSWDGKIRLLEYDRKVPIGLVSYVKKFASNMDYSIWVDPNLETKSTLTRELFDKWLAKLEIYSGGNRIQPHWYQADSVYKAIIEKRAILNLPTSAGKSLIQALLTRYYLQTKEGKVLILVPNTSLVTQMKSDLIDYRLFHSDDIAELRGGKKPGDEAVVIATWQSAIKQPLEWFEQFGMLLCDEMHLAIGKSISTIIKALVHCEYKAGLTGSLRDGKANLMQYQSLFGEVFKPVSTAQLMEEGQVTNLDINCIILEYPDKVKQVAKGLDYQSEIKAITNYKPRNTFICNVALTLAKKGENAFLMFKHVEHGKALHAELKAKYDKVYYVSGEVDADTRDALKRMAESETGVIIVASYGVFSTGISVKNLHHVLLAHPVKSAVIIKQTIGRVLRKHDSKSVAKVWDFIDDFSTTKVSKSTGKSSRSNVNYALKHGLERIKIYITEKFNYTTKKFKL